MKIDHTKPAKLNEIQITDGFWSYYQKLLREVVLPYQWDALHDNVEGAEPSRCFHNLKVAAGDIEGKYEGFVFQDHGIVTWLEAVGGSLAHHPDEKLEALADEAIDLLERVQCKDGYLNSYYIVNCPEERWTNLMECHELFCAGHLIEAAVSYTQATGKDKFLWIARRYADYIDSVFGPEDGKCKGYPGHQEIELALLKLYHATGDEKYRNLSGFFLNQRGTAPYYFDLETEKLGGKRYWSDQACMTPDYFQAHQPVREQRKAVGHAVRAVYQYAAMAEFAAETEDLAMAKACCALFDNITQKQMYITGGIGSTHFGEAFTFDYDLPNETIYQETCASIGLVFFASRMLMLDHNSRYVDVIERALYNSVLSGIARDGKSFFYVNPLEVWPEACEKNPERRHVKAERQPWFSCACCPPNIARTIASVGQYIYSTSEAGVYVNLYVGGTFSFDKCGNKITLVQKEDYLQNGSVQINVKTNKTTYFMLALRKPGWCREMKLKVNGETVASEVADNGYVILEREWLSDDCIEILFEMPVVAMRANPLVRADAGKIALMRGPLVYCLEEVDNGNNLSAISISSNQTFDVAECTELDGMPVILGKAKRLNENAWSEEMLYAPVAEQRTVNFCAVPYAFWGNRAKGEMMVWIREIQ